MHCSQQFTTKHATCSVTGKDTYGKTRVTLPCHISWLGCVSENNLYILNTEVAVPSDKVILLPITGKTCAVGTYLATSSLTNSFINETCTSRQFEGQHSN